METTFNTKMAAIEKKVKDTFTNIATTITDKLKTASTDTSTKLGEIETTFSTKMAAAEKSTKDAMTNIASYVESNMKKASESVTTYCDSIASTVDTKMKEATSSIDTESGKWETTVDTAIKNVQNLFSGNFSWGVVDLPELNPGWKKTVEDAIKSVKDQFGGNFSWDVPELKIPVKLPKYKVDGKWEFDDDGNITKTPKITVEWYRRAAEMGALFNSPTVVGVGDATQPELLIGEDTLYDKIRQAVGENAGEFNQTLNFYQSGESDPAETARLVRNNTRILLNRMRGGV